MAGWEDGSPGRFVWVRGEEVGGGSLLDGVLTPGEGTRSASEERRTGDNTVAAWSALALTGDGAREKKVRVRKWQSCKPWRGSRCAIYHEHKETERCGDIFMGR
ncbi:uncharacterized protein EI97DRAFT_254972 [Westerdykella ornata]|uniref:Uncharacterized protein n=1 Tax=Westerdykella ornata TaxID=318751 RepID=A0A6A6JTV6_WESOR|nr:uncharacterized protein EI97DRAFT_254972 [Westerdykella ornata]KAF2278449.1 hypothetical protein EI97DRAFT_254972 [Westerdykella ornata]